jgi:hypothetical protein
MKQVLVILLCSFIFLSGFGKNISKERAIKVASNFLFSGDHAIKSYSSYGGKENSRIYVINFDPEGWVLVSADDNARPVIGYSYEGFFDVHEVSSNVKSWLDNQSDEILKVKPNSKWKDEWETLKERSLPVLKSASAVEPMIKAKWDQDAGWNRFCPYYVDGPDEKAFVGCVAVAMAQALHYLKYPERPNGSISYLLEPYGTISLNFDQEPAYNWSNMSATVPDDYNARLLYNCAVAVQMDFGGDGSGAYTTRVPFALQRYFGFSPSVKTISRYQDTDEWIALLKSELNNKNVLIYSGNPKDGSAGHAFNIDGYSNNNYFNFNWGWGGSFNGYYSIDNVAPGNDDFTQGQKVVIGISKPYWGPTDIILSNQSIKANMPQGTVVGNISIADYTENDVFTIEVFGPPLFEKEGYAPAKFYAENMQLKSLEPLTKGPYPEFATIRVTDNEGNKLEKGFEITVSAVTSIEDFANNFVVYPNPAKNSIQFKGITGLKSYRIFNSSGITLSSVEGYIGNSIDVSDLQNGMYFIEFISESDQNKVQKFIIQR